MAVLTAGIVACTKDDDTTPAVPVETAEVTTLNVDVVLPASVREDWRLTIDMAQKNIEQAQQKLKKQVKLKRQNLKIKKIAINTMIRSCKLRKAKKNNLY